MAAEKKNDTKAIDEGVQQPKTSGTGKKLLIGLLVVLLITLPVFGMWYWQSTTAKSQQQQLQDQIDQLKKDKEELIKAAKKLQTKKVDTCPAGLTAAQVENVHASVESMNTAALDQLMTDSVEYVVAASEKGGSETKNAAINDLASFLVGVNASWEWNIPAPTLANYKAGSYKTFIADDTIFGVSIYKHFVSMRVTCGKIDQIFVAASSDLL